MTISTRLKFLFERQLLHQNSAAEKNELLLLMSDPANEELVKNLLNNYWEKFDEDAAGPDTIFQYGQGEEILDRLLQEHVYPTQRSVRKLTMWMKVGLTAAVMAIFFGAGLFYFSNKNIDSEQSASLTADIAPGKIGATLTLANGKRIRLSDAVNGELAKEAGVSIVKSKDGQLIYKITETAESNKLNTLSTTNGETYQVRLPDGSQVWLNSASSITYTTTLLEKGKRIVRLKGEGYFEVSKDKQHPFVVKTNNQEVEVLGTHFNVNAYEDEPAVKTTLLEGRVKVNGVNGTEKMLKPGQQAALTSDGKLDVSEVSTDVAVAWKNKQFMFESDDIETIMRMIERWYDVEIEYTGQKTDERFGGGVSRFDKVSKVLKSLESTGKVHFKIQGRKIYVSK